jgi:hypothetical protein
VTNLTDDDTNHNDDDDNNDDNNGDGGGNGSDVDDDSSESERRKIRQPPSALLLKETTNQSCNHVNVNPSGRVIENENDKNNATMNVNVNINKRKHHNHKNKNEEDKKDTTSTTKCSTRMMVELPSSQLLQKDEGNNDIVEIDIDGQRLKLKNKSITSYIELDGTTTKNLIEAIITNKNHHCHNNINTNKAICTSYLLLPDSLREITFKIATTTPATTKIVIDTILFDVLPYYPFVEKVTITRNKEEEEHLHRRLSSSSPVPSQVQSQSQPQSNCGLQFISNRLIDEGIVQSLTSCRLKDLIITDVVFDDDNNNVKVDNSHSSSSDDVTINAICNLLMTFKALRNITISKYLNLNKCSNSSSPRRSLRKKLRKKKHDTGGRSKEEGNENENGIEKDFEIDYLRRINPGGRFLLEDNTRATTTTSASIQGGDDNNNSNSNSNSSSSSSSSIPLNVWPVLLERAFKTGSGYYPNDEKHQATALFYLLRHGPVLFSKKEEYSYQGPSNNS